MADLSEHVSQEVTRIIWTALDEGVGGDLVSAVGRLETLAPYGLNGIYAAWCGLAECVKFIVDTEETGRWSLTAFLEAKAAGIDDAPPDIRTVGRFFTAYMNQDAPTCLALFNAAHLDMEQGARATVLLFTSAVSILRQEIERRRTED